MNPAEGKVQRVKDLLKNMCKDVHEKEDYTLRYIMTEQVDEQTPDISMIETYKSKEGAAKHNTESHLKELFATMEKKGLLAKTPYIVKMTSQAGLDLDRKLI